MKAQSRNLLALTSIGVVFVLAACSSPASDEASSSAAASAPAESTAPEGATTTVVGFSHPASQVPLVVAIQDQVKLIGGSSGFDVLTDNAQLKLDSQLNSVQSWITQKVGAINVLPLDPNAFAPLQKEAQANGTCWTTYAVPMPDADGLVALDPAQSGQLTADAAVAWITENNPEAEVLLLTNSADRNFAARTDLPKEAIESKTKATIVAEQDAVDQATGLTVTEAALKAHPNIRVVVAFNDDGGLGAAKAFANAGISQQDVFIIGQDGSKEGLEALKTPDSYYKASVAIPLAQLATAVTDVMKNCLDGKDPLTIPIGSELVTASDPAVVEEFLKAYQ